MAENVEYTSTIMDELDFDHTSSKNGITEEDNIGTPPEEFYEQHWVSIYGFIAISFYKKGRVEIKLTAYKNNLQLEAGIGNEDFKAEFKSLWGKLRVFLGV